MIKAITNQKIGVNTKMFRTLYESLIQSVIIYAAPILLLDSDTSDLVSRTINIMLIRFLQTGGVPSVFNFCINFHSLHTML